VNAKLRDRLDRFTSALPRWWAAVRQHRGARKRAERAGEIAGRLRDEKQELEALSRDMGPEFVALVASVRLIESLAEDLNAHSQRVLGVTSDNAQLSSVSLSLQLMKKAEDVVRASDQQFDRIFTVFDELDRGLAAAASNGHALSRALVPMHFVATQFRVQACSFGAGTREQFFILAEQIQALAAEVESAVGKSLEELAHTQQASARLVSDLAAAVDEHRKTVESALGNTRKLLWHLDETFATTGEQAHRLAELSSAFTAYVSRVVVALQCEDIARQKVEHLCRALDDMCGTLSHPRNSGAFSFVAGACALQLAQAEGLYGQLEDAGKELSECVEGIDTHAALVADLARGSQCGTDRNATRQCVESMRGILSIIDATLQRAREIAECVTPLEARLSDCTAKVLTLALRLRLVALNAQVSAAQLENGAALETLAAQTRSICDSSLDSLQSIHSKVDSLAAAVAALEDGLRDFIALAETEYQALGNESSISEERLLHSSDRLLESSRAIGPVQQRLTAVSRTVVSGLRFPGAVRDAKQRTLAVFTAVVKDCQSMAAPAVDASAAALDSLAQNYTMHHERVVHAAAVGGALAVAETVTPAQQELGDNVELF
jgi:hypothetical protein